MKNVLILVVFLFCQSIMAEEGDVFGQVQITSHTGWEMFSQEIYMEREITDTGVSVFGDAYSDGDFSELAVGVAKMLGDNVQIGLGGGVARYDDILHPVIAPWIWYGDDTNEAYLEAEHYFGEEESPWWYRGYAHRVIGTTPFFAGVYGEKDVGVGPLVGWSPSENVKVFGAVPIIGTADAGGIIQISLSW